MSKEEAKNEFCDCSEDITFYNPFMRNCHAFYCLVAGKDRRNMFITFPESDVDKLNFGGGTCEIKPRMFAKQSVKSNQHIHLVDNEWVQKCCSINRNHNLYKQYIESLYTDWT